MNYNILFRGLITSEQLKKITYLSFSQESKQIISLLAGFTKKLKATSISSLIFEGTFSLLVFLVLVLAPLLLDKSPDILLVLLLIPVMVFALALFFSLPTYHHLKEYSNLMSDLGDKLLNIIFDDYRLSLGETLPEVSQTRQMTVEISEGAVALKDYLSFYKEMAVVMLSLLVLLVLGLSTPNRVFFHLGLLITAFLIFYLIKVLFEAFHTAFITEHTKLVKEYDESFIRTQPLLTRTVLGFEKSSYLGKLRANLALADNNNFITLTTLGLLPLLLLTLPFWLPDPAEGLYLLVVGLYLCLKFFTLKNPLLSRAATIRSSRTLDQVEFFLDLILAKGSEISPNMYREMRQEMIEHDPRQRVGNRVIWGDLNIEGLTYFTGWSPNKKRIYVDKLSLPCGKVSFLVGDNGVGKTLFGQVITLRYSNFTADSLCIGQKDIRTFKSLDQALGYLHYSSLRNISTSFRVALSSYIRDAAPSNIFVQNIFKLDKKVADINRHFLENKAYYGNLSDLVSGLLEEDGPAISRAELSEGHLKLAADIFKSLARKESLLEILKELKSTMGEDVFNKAFLVAVRAEYLAYKHLKNYVPEASLNFMDANLSKPPISKETRLRFLYALDVFMNGLLLVVDEPFSKLNPDLAMPIFNDLADYAKRYKAVVLILDEKIYSEVIEENKGKGVLGKVLRFEDDGFSLLIKSNELE